MTQITMHTKYKQEKTSEGEWKRGIIMKKTAILTQAILFIAMASAAYSQSLADIADKEKERREEITNEKIITNEEAAKYKSEPLTNGPDQPTAKLDSEKKPSESNAASKSEKTELDEPVDFQGRPESYWRQTMADARQKVKDLENEGNVIVLKIADLQNQFYREDNGFRREGIQREIQKSFYEQDKNKEELAKAQDILQGLEKDARKSGALPGWIQEK
jgi:hypothetical protein